MRNRQLDSFAIIAHYSINYKTGKHFIKYVYNLGSALGEITQRRQKLYSQNDEIKHVHLLIVSINMFDIANRQPL